MISHLSIWNLVYMKTITWPDSWKTTYGTFYCIYSWIWQCWVFPTETPPRGIITWYVHVMYLPPSSLWIWPSSCLDRLWVCKNPQMLAFKIRISTYELERIYTSTYTTEPVSGKMARGVTRWDYHLFGNHLSVWLISWGHIHEYSGTKMDCSIEYS